MNPETEMTPGEMRVAIATHLCWTDVGPMHGTVFGVHPRGCIDEPAEMVPDFCNSLDACHEMEKVLFELAASAGQRQQLVDATVVQRYLDNLHEITSSVEPYRCNTFATALQRCRAFVATLNLKKQ